MNKKLATTELGCKIGLLVVFTAFYLLALPFPEKARQFPQLIAVVSVALTVLALIVDFSRKSAVQAEIPSADETELVVPDASTRQMRRRRYYRAWAIIGVSTAAGMLGGFFFSALGLTGGFSVLFGSRQHMWRNALASVAILVGVYLVFGRLMGVPLLSGMLWST